MILVLLGRIAALAGYDWTIHVWLRCGLMSNYFDYLFIYSCLMFFKK